MKIGKMVRKMAGPLEPMLANAYREFFFDVDGFADEVAKLGEVDQVVEIGCGEGALITSLAKRMPKTRFLGVDVCAEVGRLFEGDKDRVQFRCADAQVIVDEGRVLADLVIVCDVMHHVPVEQRHAVWDAATKLAKPSGRIVFKEWLKQGTPIYWVGYASDRYITGDEIQYETKSDWMCQMSAQAPGWGVVGEMKLRPWRTNHAFVLERTAG